ncbi:hypothetical protein PTKIN_Ptkin09bG0264500 [Pterospermum kingtungense]
MEHSIDPRNANLSTVFINNLSCRVSKNVLWEIFNLYGRVANVFINYSSNKSSTFAFVRFWSDLDSRRAITEENGRCIDGWVISVNKAIFGWNQRRSYEYYRDKDRSIINKRNSSKVKDVRYQRSLRFYGDALMKPIVRHADEQPLEGIKEEVTLDNKVSPSGAISGVNERDKFLNFVTSLASMPIESISKWGRSGCHRKFYAWILLDEVPIQLWNLKFFEALGNRWGSFIQVDKPTQFKTRLDISTIAVHSLAKIPNMVNVCANGDDHRIIVSIEKRLKKELKDISVDDCEVHEVVNCDGSRLQGKTSKGIFDDSLFLLLDRPKRIEFAPNLSEIHRPCGKVGEDCVMEYIDSVLENYGDPMLGTCLGCEVGPSNINHDLGGFAMNNAIVPWEGTSFAGYDDFENSENEGCVCV